MAKENAEKVTSVNKFTKAQLLDSARFIKFRDLIGALLKDNEQYSIAEVEAAIDNYMKGKVK